MPEDESDPDYLHEAPSTAPTAGVPIPSEAPLGPTKEDVPSKEDVQRYGESKPRRVVTRANVIHQGQ